MFLEYCLSATKRGNFYMTNFVTITFNCV